jgi:hypothetical protein
MQFWICCNTKFGNSERIWVVVSSPNSSTVVRKRGSLSRAEELYCKALRIAREQEAKMWEESADWKYRNCVGGARNSGSHETPCLRGVDSNFRFRDALSSPTARPSSRRLLRW